MSEDISPEQLKAICNVIADTSSGLTKSELKLVLGQCGIEAVDDGYRSNGYTYSPGLNKRDWLYNCLANEMDKSRRYTKFYSFLESALNPARYTVTEKRPQFEHFLIEVNNILLFAGLEIQRNGKLQPVMKAETLDEVDRRVNSLNRQLYYRAIHEEVKKYCNKDLLRKDYYDAVFEASKGLAQRVRDISGLQTDGSKLFQTAFSSKDPYIAMNKLTTETENNEHNGLRELLEAIFHLIRNPAAHTPKINWKTDETKALDVLTMISLAHKYLDECFQVPHLKAEGQ
ncbi:MAG: TIGR02391 family protein [Treponema sp.]|jgi:uncharacterized protein (TIGR02391 family)|nr:TIGR02391 family protein [Treponema sp.]